MSYQSNNPRIISQQFRPQSADPSNPLEGQVFRSDGTSRGVGLWEYRSGAWQPLGSAIGGLDVIFQLSGNESISSWLTGNNATFLGGGSLAGTLAYETSNPLNGLNSYKYTQASGSANDYIASPEQDVPIRFRGTQVTCTFPYTYDGDNSDIEVVIWDATNSAKLTTASLSNLVASSKAIYKINVNIPLTCESIQFGFKTLVENSGAILNFDDVVLSADTTEYADPSTVTDFESYTPTLTGFGTPTNVSFRYRRIGDAYQVEGSFTCGTVAATLASITLPMGASLNTNKLSRNNTSANPGSIVGNYSVVGANNNGNLITAPATNTSVIYFAINYTSAANQTPANGSTVGVTGANAAVSFMVPIAGLTASNPQIIAASESFSSDTNQLTYSNSLTLSTLANAPVGSFITFRYASTSSNTRTQSSTAPTQTTSDMNLNGIQVFTRAYNATSTDASPAVVAIQVGKNLKAASLQVYKSTSKVNAGSLDLQGTTAKYGAVCNYNESTGILIIDAGVDLTTSSTSANFQFGDNTSQTSGYITINASKSPALVGVPQVLPRFALLKDVKANNTAGGTFTSGSYQTRTLNTLEDSSGIVTSLSSNQFTLPAGDYYIDAYAPHYFTSFAKAKIRNITDSTDAIIGQVSYAGNTTESQPISYVSGFISITSSKTFELQHRCQTTRATDGFGLAINFGDEQTFSIVKITKIR